VDLIHFYDTKIKWTKGKEGVLREASLAPILTAIAPPFPGGVPGVWSPEHLFVASINACLMTTFLAIAENSKLEFIDYECAAIGKLEKIGDQYMISEVVLQPVIKVKYEKDIHRAERVIIKSKHICLISNSVKTQIVLQPKIMPADLGHSLSE
jgi:organic hydroperoxide reductase OsmC/OhrA